MNYKKLMDLRHSCVVRCWANEHKTFQGSFDMKRTALGLLLVSVTIPASLDAIWAADWPPISQEELAMADDPHNPGAAAIILRREVTTDDVKSVQVEYRRIKILNDEGKKYADIEIAYLDKSTKIEDVQARTTRPDGTSVEFRGQTFDRTVLKARKTRVQVKAFTLPDVQKGSIIEYSYTTRSREEAPEVLRNWRGYIFSDTVVVPSAEWVVQEELSTVRARFVVLPFKQISFFWSLKWIPEKIHPISQKDGSLVFEVQNIAGFRAEELGPPEYLVRSRILCYYVLGPPVSQSFWTFESSSTAKALEEFMGDPRKLKPFLEGIIRSEDPPEKQLRQLYSRVQRIRYLHMEQTRTQQEERRESIKENKNVKDILVRDYAYGNEINLAFIALARAAGFESALVRITSRDTTFFDPQLPLSNQLNSAVVWVRAGRKDYFLDPATKFCPFDLLPWEETSAQGIILHSTTPSYPLKSETQFAGVISTPNPVSSAAVIERTAALELSPDGGVSGSLAVRFVGQEALSRRLEAIDSDETSRKKALEEEIKNWLLPAATVELKSPANWEESDQPLRATFSLKIPEFAVPAGRRLLFRAGFFEGSVKSFEAGTRKYDIYFPYLFQRKDEITWTLPAEYRIGILPEKRKLDTVFGSYDMSVEAEANRIQCKRNFISEALYVPVSHYAAIRTHFNLVRQGDESQIVLEDAEAPDANK